MGLPPLLYLEIGSSPGSFDLSLFSRFMSLKFAKSHIIIFCVAQPDFGLQQAVFIPLNWGEKTIQTSTLIRQDASMISALREERLIPSFHPGDRAP